MAMVKSKLRQYMEANPSFSNDEIQSRFKRATRTQINWMRGAIKKANGGRMPAPRIEHFPEPEVRPEVHQEKKPLPLIPEVELTIMLPPVGARIKLMTKKGTIGNLHVGADGLIFSKANKKLRPSKVIKYVTLDMLHAINE